MKNIYCLLIVCLGLPVVVFSQDYEVTWSPHNEESPKFGYAWGSVQFQALKKEKDFFYGSVGNYDDDILHKISYDGEILESVEYVPDFRRGSSGSFRYFQTKAGMFRAESIRNKQKQEWVIRSTKLGKDLDGEPKVQMQYQLSEAQKFVSMFELWQNYSWDNLDFNFSMSPDSSKVAFGCLLEGKRKRKDPDQYAVFVFDENMELVKQAIHTLPGDATEQLAPHQLTVANDGRVYLPAMYREHEWKTQPIFKVFVLEENELKEISVELGGKLLPSNAAIFSMKEDNTIILTGIYEEWEEEIKGTYYARLSLDGKPIEIKTHPFEASFVEDMKNGERLSSSLSDKLKGKYLSVQGENHYVRESQIFPNGDYQFITEYYSKAPTLVKALTQEYRYGNILVTTINKEGERINITRLRRSLFPYTSSKKGFFTFQKDGKTHILYDTQAGTWNTAVRLCIIDPKKNQPTERMIFTSKEIKASFIALSGFLIDDNQLFFGGTVAKKTRGNNSRLYFGTIDLE